MHGLEGQCVACIGAIIRLGNCAFIASRYRQEGYRLRGRGSPVPDGRMASEWMASEWILQVASERCKETNAVQLTDLGQFSPAHSMRASPCGTATTRRTRVNN